MLLEKTLERGWRAVVETSSRERATALDAMLWTYRDDSFLPHGIAGDETDADQPVLIATDDGNANARQCPLLRRPRGAADRARAMSASSICSRATTPMR